MKYKDRYTIGEVSKICNISTKALRYYDKIGLITSERDFTNNYRYYSREALLALPVIKYYKQMGFTLDEMRHYIEGSVYQSIKRSFKAKIQELEKIQEEIRRKYISVRDWYDLIAEAELVIDNNFQDVSIKYVDSVDLLFLDQEFKNDIQDSIINIEFTNYVESVSNEITGAVMIRYASHKDRIKGKPQPMQILQKALIPPKEAETVTFGGEMMISCYHIGAHDTIGKTYEKICFWAECHGYTISDESFERYVTDYWTTRDSGQYVTEIMLGVARNKDKG